MGKYANTRKELVAYLLSTRHATSDISPGDISRVAESLGITVNLLEEVRLRAKMGEGTGFLKMRSKSYNPVSMLVPSKIRELIVEESSKKAATPSGLFRSILHEYARNSWEPTIADTWTHGGVRYVTAKDANMKTTISKGLFEALVARCLNLNIDIPKLSRSLLLDFLSGKLEDALGDIVIRAKSQMHPNKEDYFLVDS